MQQTVISLHLPSTLKLRRQTSGSSVSPENMGTGGPNPSKNQVLTGTGRFWSLIPVWQV